MHAFYLRMFAHHCRSIWGMDINFEDGDGILFDRDPNHPTEAEMQIAHQVLEFGSNEALKDLRVAIVRQLCRETSTLEFRGRKGLLLQRLLEYVSC
jgi:hypothetical protein